MVILTWSKFQQLKFPGLAYNNSVRFTFGQRRKNNVVGRLRWKRSHWQIQEPTDNKIDVSVELPNAQNNLTISMPTTAFSNFFSSSHRPWQSASSLYSLPSSSMSTLHYLEHLRKKRHRYQHQVSRRCSSSSNLYFVRRILLFQHEAALSL